MILLALLAVLIPSLSQATTYYIKADGNDSLNGQSESNAWKTWSKAFGSSTACGDVVIAVDGTYDPTVNGNFVIQKVCPGSLTFTVQAKTERMAFIDGSAGTAIPILVGSTSATGTNSAAYITVEGLRARSGDLAPTSGGVNNGVCNIYHANNITFRHMVCSHPNRYRNAGHVYQLVTVVNSLLEENEAYYFHRHGFFIGTSSNDNVIRRNYCNGRNYDDLSGGGVENPTDGPSEVGPDDCYIVYPGSRNIFENNIAEGDMLKHYAIEAISGGADSNQFLGNIGLGGAWNGMALDARGSTAGTMPTNTVLEHMYIEGTNAHGVSGQTASTYRFNGNKNTRCANCTAINSVDSFLVSRLSAQPGDGIYSVTLENSLSLDAQRAQASGSFSTTTGYGFFIDPIIGTWTATNVNAFNSFKTNYSPSTNTNYDPVDTPVGIDPQMGTCKVWQPDGSAAKVNNWGANILYRYQNGVLGVVPLWDPTTGEFPHGAIVAGVNDLAGSSPFDVHMRLNVNTNGCSFPAGYAAGTPVENPGTYVSSTGVNGTSHTHVIPSGTDALIVFVHLRDGGANVGSVNSVGGCGGEPLTFLGGGKTTPGYHTVEVWGRLNPTPGTCTIIVTTTGTITSMITTSIAQDDVVSFSGSGGGASFSATPSLGVPTASGDLLIAGTSAASAFTLTAGSGQTLRADTANGPSRLAISTQLGPGSDGGTMDYVVGGVGYWAEALVKITTGSSGSPSTSVFTVSKYQIYGLLGSTSTPEVSLGSLAGQSTLGHIGINGAGRIRAEVTVSVDNSDPTAIALYCQKNGGTFARIGNVFGANDIRLHGPGTEKNMPTDNAVTTQRFSGTFSSTGVVIRDDGFAHLLGVTPNGSRLETDHLIVVGNTAVAGDTYVCQLRRDDGSTLGVHTSPITIVADGPSASMGF